MRLRIITGEFSMEAELDDSATSRQIMEALPFEASADTWGDEVYFSIPVDAPPENPVESVKKGDIAYWPPGKAFCIFFGSTPGSPPGEIKPASAVNPLGRLLGDPEEFRKVSAGEKIRLE